MHVIVSLDFFPFIKASHFHYCLYLLNKFSQSSKYVVLGNEGCPRVLESHPTLKGLGTRRKRIAFCSNRPAWFEYFHRRFLKCKHLIDTFGIDTFPTNIRLTSPTNIY
jgi:hypothetical protein